jgi:ferredoxin-type protein NapG
LAPVHFLAILKNWLISSERPIDKNFAVNRLRPPGAVEEAKFMACCIRCNRCLEVCPYGSIKREGFDIAIGTPYVYPEKKACYLCMACCRLCPTGALDNRMKVPEKVMMGKAKIDKTKCYSHLFIEHDVLPDSGGTRIGALCNTCYYVCPLQDKAIMLKDNLFPVILDGCVGCGICVERCPTSPKRAINITPTGMGRPDEVGFYFRKARHSYETSLTPQKIDDSKPLAGEKLLERKFKIEGADKAPKFEFPYEAPKTKGDWD